MRDASARVAALAAEQARADHGVIALRRVGAAIANDPANQRTVEAVEPVLRPDLDRAPRVAEEPGRAAFEDLFELQIGFRRGG
ncbi:MAG: hypothetical protein H6720_04585 [Sandaracinus sp.]|nr:hypothetical protein [Sandaracinus sp.]